MSTITLSGDYRYTPYSVSNLAADSIIDANAASWIQDNNAAGGKNAYPFMVNGGSGLLIDGGTILGNVDQTGDWRSIHNLGNSAGLRVENTPNVIIDDWRIDKAWDAFRIAGGSNNWLIDDAYVTNVRDDAIENDSVLSGTIRDSLFDGVFTGISLGDSDMEDGSGNTVTFDSVLMRMQIFSYEGEMTHYSPIKANKDAPDTMPDLRFINTVFAISDPNHEGQARLKLGWDNVVESRGNVFLNLSDTPLSSSYPKPGAGWTILQGQAARDYWNQAKATWLANHEDGANETPPPVPAPEPTTPPVDTINGTSRDDILSGTLAHDTISGLGGNDRIYGKGGNDKLSGGVGKDYFIFDTKPGTGNFDQITDFNVTDDTLYLDNAIFTKLGSGSLSSPRKISSSLFEVREKAVSSNDYLVYHKNTGTLFYDSDGSGSQAMVEILKVQANTSLTYNDIYII